MVETLTNNCIINILDILNILDNKVLNLIVNLLGLFLIFFSSIVIIWAIFSLISFKNEHLVFPEQGKELTDDNRWNGIRLFPIATNVPLPINHVPKKPLVTQQPKPIGWRPLKPKFGDPGMSKKK